MQSAHTLFNNNSETNSKEKLKKLLNERGDIKQIESCINQIPESQQAHFLNETYALFGAVASAHVEAVELLLKVKGLELNLVKQYMGSLLHVAITQVHQFRDKSHKLGKQPEIIRLLVEAGADIGIRDQCSNEQGEQIGTGEAPLVWAFKRGNEFDVSSPEFQDYCDIAVYLLKEGADINDKDLLRYTNKGNSALYKAVMQRENEWKDINDSYNDRIDNNNRPLIKRKQEETEESESNNKIKI